MSIYGGIIRTTKRHYAVNKLIRRMSSQWLMAAIDAGTTSSRMMVFDQDGSVVCMSRHPVALHCPEEGWAEHDPKEVLMSVDRCMEECGNKLKNMGKLDFVKGIGLAVHRESTVAFDSESGEPLSKMILWMDTRTKELVRSAMPYASEIKSKTGLLPSTYFSAFKMKWIASQIPSRNCHFATADTWILKHLTGEYKTDVTNASRTMLMNLRDREFDDGMLEMFSIDQNRLPKICESRSIFGKVRMGPFAGLNVSAVMGDQQASQVGQDCLKKGDAKCTLGTGAFILVNTGNDMVDIDGYISTISGDRGYAIEAPIAMAASGINWIKTIIKDDTELGSSDGVVFIPALSGLLAPHWRPDMTASFRNLSLKTTARNMFTAVLESIAFSVSDCLTTINAHIPIKRVKMDGGLSNDERLLQMIADCSGITLETLSLKECTALGVAKAAAETLGLKIFTDSRTLETVIIEPQINEPLLITYSKWKETTEQITKKSQ